MVMIVHVYCLHFFQKTDFNFFTDFRCMQVKK